MTRIDIDLSFATVITETKHRPDFVASIMTMKRIPFRRHVIDGQEVFVVRG